MKKFYWNLTFLNRHISLYSTQRAYILKNELADLETALVRYTLNYLNNKVCVFSWFSISIKSEIIFELKKGFTLVSVPDILHHSIIVNFLRYVMIQRYWKSFQVSIMLSYKGVLWFSYERLTQPSLQAWSSEWIWQILFVGNIGDVACRSA